MSDDVCGAECADGTPCQHPAGSCPVPSHSDPDAENPHGREFSIDEDDHDDILDAARDGLSKAGCARAAGVDKASLLRYLDAHPDFRTAFRRARSEGEQTLVREPLYDDDMDGQHARFLLSSSFEYVRTEKQELENTGDEPLADVTIDFTDVDT